MSKAAARCVSGRRFDVVRGVLGLGVLVAVASCLSACASGSYLERGPMSAESIRTDEPWGADAQVRPMPVTSAPRKPGSMPLLPPVPESSATLQPVTVSAMIE